MATAAKLGRARNPGARTTRDVTRARKVEQLEYEAQRAFEQCDNMAASHCG